MSKVANLVLPNLLCFAYRNLTEKYEIKLLFFAPSVILNHASWSGRRILHPPQNLTLSQ